jgi:hypothetical protein
MIQARSRASPPRVAGRAASSTNLADNGIQTIVLKNVLLKQEQMLSRIVRNRNKVDSGELRKAPDTQPWHFTPCVGAVGFHFTSRRMMEDTWQTKG